MTDLRDIEANPGDKQLQAEFLERPRPLIPLCGLYRVTL
jgi:hypothetical protein